MQAIETISDWSNGNIFIEKQFHPGFFNKKYDANISLKITFRELGFFFFFPFVIRENWFYFLCSEAPERTFYNSKIKQ